MMRKSRPSRWSARTGASITFWRAALRAGTRGPEKTVDRTTALSGLISNRSLFPLQRRDSLRLRGESRLQTQQQSIEFIRGKILDFDTAPVICSGDSHLGPE